jgi:hypothetical protein
MCVFVEVQLRIICNTSVYCCSRIFELQKIFHEIFFWPAIISKYSHQAAEYIQLSEMCKFAFFRVTGTFVWYGVTLRMSLHPQTTLWPSPWKPEFAYLYPTNDNNLKLNLSSSSSQGQELNSPEVLYLLWIESFSQCYIIQQFDWCFEHCESSEIFQKQNI